MYTSEALNGGLSLGEKEMEESMRRGKAARRKLQQRNFPGTDIGKQYGHGSDLARAHMKSLEGLKYHRIIMVQKVTYGVPMISRAMPFYI